MERPRLGLARRTRALGLAVLAEALLILLVLTLGAPGADHAPPKRPSLVEMHAIEPSRDRAEQPDRPTPTTRQQAAPAAASPQRDDAVPAVAPAPIAAVPPPPLLRISPSEMAAANIASIPRSPGAPPARSRMGPVDTGNPMPDTARVAGSGPNGEALYAASWYREPYDDELRGYLSTATGPGWGLIACRTAPDFRVEDCIKLDEYPEGSNIARSVLAAAWQFRVRPPRLGGQLKIGEWVRIRIDYDLRRSRES